MHRLPNGHVHFTAFLEGEGQELITYGAITLGQLLRGEDVESLLPSLADYFQDDYGIYQNRIGDRRSEYWYLMYVNALAASITRLALADDRGSVDRVYRSMVRLRELAHQIDYNFDDQGYDFEHGRPFTDNDAFRQPDTVGGYAFLMQFAYEMFGEDSFRKEAEIGLDKYLSFAENPWYEIPSGAMACLATARMNATGSKFPMEKAIGFALDSTQGSLHKGKWGSEEINGLMRGWRGHTREEASSMAYSLETWVLLPYLLPVVRYEPSLAREIGKYALHASCNARMFFSDQLPEGSQARPDLSAAVPYEALHKERDGHSPYAAGDFFGQKSIYGGALTLWWGAIIRQTSDPYVLGLNVTKTDFLNPSADEIYLYYNPHGERVEIVDEIGDRAVDLYDFTTGTLLHKGVSGHATLVIEPDQALIVKWLPSA